MFAAFRLRNTVAGLLLAGATASLAFALPLAPALAADTDACPLSTPAKVVWVSPRGTLEVMDDYPLWVALDRGYFKDLGLEVELQPGVSGGPTHLALLTGGQADSGYPSPAIMAAAIDAGIKVQMGFGMAAGQVFDFAVREDSDIKTVKDLAGKTVALWDVSGSNIVAPILSEQGVDPASINYVGSGQWGQLVGQGQADAALAWEGLRAQWNAIGLPLRYLIGSEFSNDPSNGYVIRASDAADPAKVQVMTCFFRGVAMGLEFGRLNPQAAAQITYNQFAAVREQMKPDLALESMRQLMYLYNITYSKGQGYGYSDAANWQSYLERLFKLGQTTRQITTDEAITNAYVENANAFDAAKVAADAKAFELAPEWKDVALKGPVMPAAN
ncbi:MAG: ABC transporter substrate-binding protein [Rhizobiaceae bacterium]|nr:ABC transporter substrate-binding protein [Rhizobiaceae bacterium]